MNVKTIVLFAVALLFFLLPLNAQDIAIPATAIITSENVDKLELLTSWQGAENSLAVAAFSPDGTMLALARNDGVIRLFDFPSLEPRREISGVDFEARWIQFSPDGSHLMLSNWQGRYGFWELRTGELIHTYNLGAQGLWGGVSADLRFLVTADHDENINVIDVEINDAVFSVVQADILPRPTLNADGSLLLTVDPNGFSVWDLRTGTIAYQFDDPEHTELEGFGFSPDGQLIWANWRDWLYGRDPSENRSILQFWNVADGSEVTELRGGGSHSQMVFSHAGNLAATAGENDTLQSSVWVWDMAKGELLGEAGIPTGGSMPSFSPDGALLAVGKGTDIQVDIWDAHAPERRVKTAVDIESGALMPPAFSPDGRFLLTVGYDIRLWGVVADP